MRTALLTAAALIGFAANSLLCRAALGAGTIDPIAFTFVRLVSGAALLAPLAAVTRPRTPQTAGSGGSWSGALALFIYAVLFSLAYVRLTTGTGALLLFGSVQATMLGVAIARGERPRAGEWAGLAVALAGLAALVAPGVTAPDPLAALAMAAAGAAWGAYTLLGRGATRPLATTAGNFVRAAPLALGLAAWAAFSTTTLRLTPSGIELAAASGVVASGLGYTLWYAALPSLTAARAALLQLSVPVIAAAAGVIFLDETPTLRLAACSAAVLGGIAIAIAARRRPTPPSASPAAGPPSAPR